MIRKTKFQGKAKQLFLANKTLSPWANRIWLSIWITKLSTKKVTSSTSSLGLIRSFATAWVSSKIPAKISSGQLKLSTPREQ